MTYTGDILDMLFSKTNPDIAGKVGSTVKNVGNTKGMLNQDVGKILGKAGNGLGATKKYIGGTGAFKALNAMAAADQWKKTANLYKTGHPLYGTSNAILATIDTANTLLPAPAKQTPVSIGIGLGGMPAHGLEAYLRRKNEKRLGIDTLKDRDLYNELEQAGLLEQDPKTGLVKFSPELSEFIGNTTPQKQTQNVGGYPNVSMGGQDYGVIGKTGEFINGLTGQNTNIQPEVSTINSTETLPQDEQSTQPIDLSGVNGQYDAANQDYLNKLIEFAQNYQQNAANDNRRNLALAMIAKGTHNPYLMQAGRLDNNKQMLEQLKIEEAIKEAQLKPIERAQAAIAYAKAGLPPELAYLSDKAMSPFASMYRTDMTRQNILDQIAARDSLQRYINEGRWAMQQMQEEGRNRRQLSDQQYRISDPYIQSKMIPNIGYIYPELPENIKQDIINRYIGGKNVGPLTRLINKTGNTPNTDTGIIPALEVNR